MEEIVHHIIMSDGVQIQPRILLPSDSTSSCILGYARGFILYVQYSFISFTPHVIQYSAIVQLCFSMLHMLN
jgi:hypothetical protein